MNKVSMVFGYSCEMSEISTVLVKKAVANVDRNYDLACFRRDQGLFFGGVLTRGGDSGKRGKIESCFCKEFSP